MNTGIAYGGPRDGERMDLPSNPAEVIEIWSEWAVTKEPPIRRCRKVYLYEQDSHYRGRLHFVGEDVVWEDEEVKTNDSA